jgi:hypothetical protein
VTAVYDGTINFSFYVLKNLTHANACIKTYSKGYGEKNIWQHFPGKEKRKNNNKARMGIGGMNFIRLEY